MRTETTLALTQGLDPSLSCSTDQKVSVGYQASHVSLPSSYRLDVWKWSFVREDPQTTCSALLCIILVAFSKTWKLGLRILISLRRYLVLLLTDLCFSLFRGGALWSRKLWSVVWCFITERNDKSWFVAEGWKLSTNQTASRCVLTTDNVLALSIKT